VVGARPLAALGAALLLTSCGGERTPPATSGLPGGGVPLITAVPEGPCPSPPPPVEERVEGLVLPEGAYLTEVVRQGPLVQVRGRVDRTPLELRAEYEQRDDVEVLTLEDEGVEVETLVSTGGFRTYLRGTALCATASALDGLVSPEAG
jgi:hypothetical protein